MSKNVRAVIIAAGRGSRLGEHTIDRPKCMLDIGDKTLLQRQIESLVKNDIQDIHVIRGYQKEKIDYSGITYHDNDQFEKNNVLNSLFCAESALAGEVIVSYSDILFRPEIVDQLLRTAPDISLVVDTDWKAAYVDRLSHPPQEAENVVFDHARNVVRIGKNIGPQVDGEFIGMMKLNTEGATALKAAFHQARDTYAGGPFQRASSFEVAYLTDLIQEMVDLGASIHCACIAGGWIEIDTPEDLLKAQRFR